MFNCCFIDIFGDCASVNCIELCQNIFHALEYIEQHVSTNLNMRIYLFYLQKLERDSHNYSKWKSINNVCLFKIETENECSDSIQIYNFSGGKSLYG